MEMLRRRVPRPLASEGCSNKLKNQFVLPVLAGSGQRARCKGAPLLRAPKNSSCCLWQGDSPNWELGPLQIEREGKKIIIPFWATLGSLHYRLCGFPHNHTFLFFKSVSFNEQWEGKVPFKLRTNT